MQISKKTIFKRLLELYFTKMEDGFIRTKIEGFKMCFPYPVNYIINNIKKLNLI